MNTHTLVSNLYDSDDESDDETVIDNHQNVTINIYKLYNEFKICKRCGIAKPLDFYNIVRSFPKGVEHINRRTNCRQCRSIIERERQKNSSVSVTENILNNSDKKIKDMLIQLICEGQHPRAIAKLINGTFGQILTMGQISIYAKHLKKYNL
jgi:hypothetical protein